MKIACVGAWGVCVGGKQCAGRARAIGTHKSTCEQGSATGSLHRQRQKHEHTINKFTRMVLARTLDLTNAGASARQQITLLQTPSPTAHQHCALSLAICRHALGAHASLAQLAEHALRKRTVVGSIPTGGFPFGIRTHVGACTVCGGQATAAASRRRIRGIEEKIDRKNKKDTKR